MRQRVARSRSRARCSRSACCRGVARRAADGDDVQTSADAGRREPQRSARAARRRARRQRKVHVIVTVKGSTAEVAGLLEGEHVGHVKGIALVAGTLRPASSQARHARRRRPRQRGGEPPARASPLRRSRARARARRPTHRRSPQAHRREAQAATRAGRTATTTASRARTSPPAPSLNVLDARTHRFSGAWNEGYTGEGSTVAVLDGGTDFGHPDLLGHVEDRRRTAGRRRTTRTARCSGCCCPRTSTRASPGTSSPRLHSDLVKHGRRTASPSACSTGPSRNFAAPSGTVAHAFTFPAKWTKSGTVRLASHPDDYLLQTLRRAGRRSWSPTRTRPASTTPCTSTSTATTTSPTRSRCPRRRRRRTATSTTTGYATSPAASSTTSPTASTARPCRAACELFGVDGHRRAGRRSWPGRATSTRPSRATAR